MPGTLTELYLMSGIDLTSVADLTESTTSSTDPLPRLKLSCTDTTHGMAPQNFPTSSAATLPWLELSCTDTTLRRWRSPTWNQNHQAANIQEEFVSRQ